MENVICDVSLLEDFKYLSKYDVLCSLSDHCHLYTAPLLELPSSSASFNQNEFLPLQLLEYNFSTSLLKKRDLGKVICSKEAIFLSKIDNHTLLICCTDYLSTDRSGMTFSFFSFDVDTERVEELLLYKQKIDFHERRKFINHWCTTCKNYDETIIFMCINLSCERLLIYRLNFIDRCSFQWEMLCDNLIASYYGSEINYFDNKLYYFGGCNVLKKVYSSFQEIHIFNLITSEWSSAKSCPDVLFGYPNQRLFVNTVLYKEYAIMNGGKYNNQIFDDIWLFHFPTSTWTSMTVKLPVALYSHGATVHKDSVYLFGGFTDLEGLNANTRLFRFNVDVALQLQLHNQSDAVYQSIIVSTSVASEIAAKTNPIEISREQLECEICCSKVSIQKYLPCGGADNKHAFCETCLETLASEALNGEILCPKCRTSTSLPIGGIKQLLTKMAVSLQCEDCDEGKTIRDQWWCKACKSTVCSSCILSKHQHHEYLRWENYNVPRECKKMLKKQIDSTARLVKKIKDDENKIKILLGEIEALNVEMSKSKIAVRFVESLDETFGMLEVSSEPIDEKSSEKKFRVTLELMKKLDICTEMNVDMLMDSIREN